jgi:hypothetical protein
MRLAKRVAIANRDGPGADGHDTKLLSAEEIPRINRTFYFLGSVSFWRELEKLADPETLTRLHAIGVLRELAQRSFADCGGYAYSAQHAECLTFCGFPPAGVRAPGSAGIR